MTEPKHEITSLTWSDVRRLVREQFPDTGACWGVPRGGAIVAGLTGRAVDTPEEADFIVDDIVDSGATRKKHQHLGKPFHALVDKTSVLNTYGGWIHFPWETPSDQDVGDSVVRLLQFLGEDPSRDGLLDTPKRVVKAWKEMTVGYAQEPAEILLKDFDGNGYDQIIALPFCEFVSTCEHHMLPFLGHVHIGYLPGKRVVGLSKLGRLVDCYARRLQIQEKFTKQIADAIHAHLEPRGVAVIVVAKHMCMACRGVMKRESSMVTSEMVGVFRTKPAARSEFLDLINLAPKP